MTGSGQPEAAFVMSAAVVGGRVRFAYPTLRKEREEWGTPSVGDGDRGGQTGFLSTV